MLNTHIKAKSDSLILLICTLFLRGFVLCAIFMLILSLIKDVLLSVSNAYKYQAKIRVKHDS